VRAASPEDRPQIEAYLQARVAQAMFPLSNLRNHGMAGGHPRAMRFWLAGEPLTGVLGLTEGGIVLPNITAVQAPSAAAVLAGHTIGGIVGPADGAVALHTALGLNRAPTLMAHREPHFALDLSALAMPATAGLTLTPLTAAPRDLLIDWSTAYDIETLGARPDVARAEAPDEVDAWIAADSHRVLWRYGVPVARTGFNARLPGIVQVGGVYVPPDLRGQGLARVAVALHLAEAAQGGATRATLFAASDMASRAYQAIGFRRIGEWFLCLLDGDHPVPAHGGLHPADGGRHG
jgi:GNAT superfamily N-acetyltransferase